jgi:hypothetical protein
VIISFQAMRAILLANATAASFGGLRLRRSTIQGDPRQLRAKAEASGGRGFGGFDGFFG